MEDNKILDLYWARAQQAIWETGEKYGALCHQIAYNILQDKSDAEEVVNDVYLGLWNAIPPNRPENFTAYLCRVTKNLALKRLAYNTAQKRSGGIPLPVEELPELRTPQGELEGKLLAQQLNRFLAQQPAEHRRLFIRRYWFCDSIAGLSRQFGLSESKVKSILFRMRKKLRNDLVKEGVLNG